MSDNLSNKIFWAIVSPAKPLGIPFGFAVLLLFVTVVLQLYLGTFMGIKFTIGLILVMLLLIIIGYRQTQKDSKWFDILLSGVKHDPKGMIEQLKYKKRIYK